MNRMQVFTHRDRHSRGSGYFGVTLVVVRYDWLFKPQNVLILDRMRQINGLRNCHGIIGIYHECCLGSDQGPDRANAFYILFLCRLPDLDFDRV